MISRLQVLANDLQIAFSLCVVVLIVFCFLTGVAYWAARIWEAL
ncbi:hypothetical protein [uncultured Cohaesibacter sp.]|nr:hypothetical protein [uncultured Cohaesibacter sp.]